MRYQLTFTDSRGWLTGITPLSAANDAAAITAAAASLAADPARSLFPGASDAHVEALAADVDAVLRTVATYQQTWADVPRWIAA